MLKFVCLIIFLVVSSHALEVGFYEKTCPAAESIIRGVVQREVAQDRGVAAVLLRLHFHDCFVEGCDGSILINNQANDGDGEILASGNAGVKGFEFIEQAKKELERTCPGVVSCADIVTLAARDAVSEAKGPFYAVPTGRRDGRVSKASNAADLPEPEDSLDLLKEKFRAKGLSSEDLLLLSAGAHTIGNVACFFVAPRLDSNDSRINPDFFKKLRTKCPKDGPVGVKIPLDWETPFTFDTKIFGAIKSGKGVISSDAALYQDSELKKAIDEFSVNTTSFAEEFSKAMVKMGEIGVKVGDQGEIRRRCDAIN